MPKNMMNSEKGKAWAQSAENRFAMEEGSKAMGIARAKQDLAARAVEANKKRKKRPIGPIVL